jgi:hypothetical protein
VNVTQEGYKDLDNRFDSLYVGWNAAEREKFWGCRILGIGVVVLGAGFLASNYSEYGFVLYWLGAIVAFIGIATYVDGLKNSNKTWAEIETIKAIRADRKKFGRLK